jgi:putative endonuclease
VPTISFLSMPALYILRSTRTGRFYIGSAMSLPERLAEHERGHSPYTRHRGPWRLVYTEPYEVLAHARRREREIKTWKSRRLIEELITNSGG